MPRKHVVKHGTVNEYVNFKCRCEVCKLAWAAYIMMYRKKKARAASTTTLAHEIPSTEKEK